MARLPDSFSTLSCSFLQRWQPSSMTLYSLSSMALIGSKEDTSTPDCWPASYLPFGIPYLPVSLLINAKLSSDALLTSSLPRCLASILPVPVKVRSLHLSSVPGGLALHCFLPYCIALIFCEFIWSSSSQHGEKRQDHYYRHLALIQHWSSQENCLFQYDIPYMSAEKSKGMVSTVYQYCLAVVLPDPKRRPTWTEFGLSVTKDDFLYLDLPEVRAHESEAKTLSCSIIYLGHSASKYRGWT